VGFAPAAEPEHQPAGEQRSTDDHAELGCRDGQWVGRLFAWKFARTLPRWKLRGERFPGRPNEAPFPS
jgi:hypothetical protein